MKKLLSNKAEGTELFKGKNYLPAIKFYVKALVHSGKFLSDVNKDDEAEIAGLKESLHLNLASRIQMKHTPSPPFQNTT